MYLCIFQPSRNINSKCNFLDCATITLSESYHPKTNFYVDVWNKKDGKLNFLTYTKRKDVTVIVDFSNFPADGLLPVPALDTLCLYHMKV
jgi:hypothetical protein